MDSEIFDKAHAILSQRRAKAIAENDRRIAEINEKIPEIKEINDALNNTGKELIRIISEAKGADVSEKIEQVKRNNLGAQEVAEQLLSANGYPSDYLAMNYSCPKCGDTGYINGIFCDCFNRLTAKLTTEALNQKAQLSLSSFNTFSLDFYKGGDYAAMERILSFTKNYAAQFSRNSESILIFGNTGLGKTHISLAIANEVLKKGYSVIYDSTMNILRDIEKEHGNVSKDVSADANLIRRIYNSIVYINNNYAHDL
ncbi:MAG: ATP-binding protein, partial [Ruminococcus sp.]|nr:ATP-binding protein [Ruminococcus sp.]